MNIQSLHILFMHFILDHNVTSGPPTAECPGGTEHVLHETSLESHTERVFQIQNCDNVVLPENQSYPYLAESTCTEGYRPVCDSNSMLDFCYDEYCTFRVDLCKIIATICYKRRKYHLVQ